MPTPGFEPSHELSVARSRDTPSADAGSQAYGNVGQLGRSLGVYATSDRSGPQKPRVAGRAEMPRRLLDLSTTGGGWGLSGPADGSTLICCSRPHDGVVLDL
jgi:hypothetical protein